MKRSAFVILLLIGFLAACGGRNEEPEPTATAVPPAVIIPATNTPTPPPADQRAELLTQPWAWTRFVDQAAGPTQIPDPQNYTVSFLNDNTVQVKADCNNAGGSFFATGDSLTITMGPVTLAACPAGSRSDQFLALLGGAVRYHIAGGELQIELVADGGSLFFMPLSTVAVPPTAIPPTAVPPTSAPIPPGSVVDTGPRQHANGTYTAPYYTVVAGDTLYSIGLRFGLSTTQLTAANPAAASGIYPGQQLLISSAGGGAVNPPPAGIQYERVNFDAGSIVATRNGTINNAVPAGYVLRVLAGQTMEIATTSSGESLIISVQGPDGNVLPVNGENGQGNNNTWLPVPTTGDYYVTVRPVTTPESPSMAFTITFVIQ